MLFKKLFLPAVLFTALLFLSFHPGNKTLSFEGLISYEKITLSDTVNLKYYIKDSFVRIERLNKNRELEEYKIIDFKTKKITVVNPTKELYIVKNVEIKKTMPSAGISVEKTRNFKYIQNIKCRQWIVKCKESNAIVTFWVADKHYALYGKLLQSLSETEKISDYFTYISENKGFIPLESVERSWLRDMRMKLSAKEIKEKTLPDALFTPPENYRLFE